MARKQSSVLLERRSRKHKLSVELQLPPTSAQITTVMLWTPSKITCSRRLFKRSPLEPTSHVDSSVARHVEVIENEGNFTSGFEIVSTTKDQKRNHTLVSVRVNGNV
jgi:hypothetical protein